ncbi:MAG: SIMPL domain-containing protein [Actinomycetota bacterium]|nr:SIMPL domain-containing protein [Actinomycetota bacterium]
MATEITVRGSHTTYQAPEQATVRASISFEGPAMEPVYQRVAADLGTVRDSLAPLTVGGDAPVARWSAERLRTWSNRPWHQDGARLPLVHHAAVRLAVTFGDVTALSAWVGEQVGVVEGFRIDDVVWELTPARRDELLREVRGRAVRDAKERAQQFADALGLGEVQPLALAEPGMLGGATGDSAAMPLRAAAAPAGGGREVELVPRDIELTAAVDGRFRAGA